MTELNVLKRDPNESLAALRAQGRVPGVCYGTEFESTPISFNEGEFRRVYRIAGASSVITLGGDLKGKECFVQDLQAHVVTGAILHADFKVVSANEMTEVEVPIEFVNEAPAVQKKLGIIYTSHHELRVEAVPSKVPASFEVDLSGLNEVGDSIKVSDIKVPTGVTILEDAETTIVSITGLQEEREETGPTMEEVLAAPVKEDEAK